MGAIAKRTGPLTDSELRAQAIDVSGAITTISGTVAVSGPLTDTELRATAVPISVASVPSHAVTNAGTFAVQATLGAETTKVIGTVNVAAAQTIAATNAGTFAVQESGAALTALQTIDNAISGSGINISQLGGVATSVSSNGALRTTSQDYLHALAEGLVSGHEAWSKIGYNGDVDAGTEDMISQGGTYTWPAAEGSMDIVSSSVEDDPDKGGAVAGTGIHTVTLYYLDDGGVEKSVDINLNGTAAVETSVSDIYRVQNMRAKVCGTGGKAAGDISLSEHGGTTYKYGFIPTGMTRMRQCVWTVPTGKTLYVTSIAFSVGGATKEKAAVFTTLATYDNKAAAVRTFFFPYTEVVIEDSAYHNELMVPTKLPAGTDLKVQVRGLVADCVCSCTLRGWIE